MTDARRPVNGLAIVSLALSIASFCSLPIVGAIAALVTGHLARRQIARTGEDGAELATAGIVIAWIHLGLVFVAIAAAVVLAVVAASAAWFTPAATPSPFFPTPS
jgi:hypothetical protein